MAGKDGTIGAVASIPSSILVGSPPSPAKDETPSAVPAPVAEVEMAAMKNELAAVRQLLEKLATGGDPQ